MSWSVNASFAKRGLSGLVPRLGVAGVYQVLRTRLLPFLLNN